MPTILAAADVDPPLDHPLDGIDLLPVLTSGESVPRRKLFWGFGNSRAMRDGDWKLVLNAPGQERPELFRLDEDLEESQDLAAVEPMRVKRMLAEIKKWEKEMQDSASPQPK